MTAILVCTLKEKGLGKRTSLIDFRLWLFFLCLLTSTQTIQAQFKETYFERGFKEVRKKNYTKAIEYLNYSINDREYYQAYFFRAYSKFQLGDLAGSERDFTACLWKVPTHRDALHYRAVVRSKLLNYEAAFQDFEKAIMLDSNNAEIYLNRAITLLSVEKYDAVISDCNKAESLNPRELNAKIIRAIAHTEQEKFNEALVDFNTVLRSDPFNLLALTHRAACYRQMKEFALAEDDLTFILLKDSLNIDALVQLALLENDKQHPKEALSLFNKVLNLSPHNSIALFNRGITRSILKNYQGALADYNKVIATNHSNVSVYFNRALVYQHLNNFEAALADFDKVIELLPNFSQAYMARAQIKKTLSDYNGAEKDIQLAEAANLQNMAMAQKGISDREIQRIMKTIKLANSAPKEVTDANEVEAEYISLSLRSFFHLVPTHFVSDLSNHYLDKGELDMELMGLITNDFELDLLKVKQEIDSLENTSSKLQLNNNYFLKRGILYTQTEDYNLAFENLDTSISLDTTNMLAFFGRANVRMKLKELQEEFEEPSLQYFQGGQVKTYKDSVFDEDHSYKKIIEDYKKAIALNPSFSYAFFNLSYAQLKNNQIQPSLASLNHAIRLKENFAEAYFNRGLIHLYLKNLELACDDLSMAGQLGINDAYSVILRYCSN